VRRVLFIVSVLVLGGTVACVAQDRGEALHRLLLGHQQQKKDFGVQDVYKLLFQAHLGIGHMVQDSVSAAQYLGQELTHLDTTIHGEELVERISTDGDAVRINLRPFMVRRIPPLILVRAMLASDRAWRPDTAGLRYEWEEFVTLIRTGALTFPRDEVERWNSRIQGGLLDPVHHSESYTRSNRPAYRVVRRSIWDQAWREGTP
jgi:hypothetical protein